MNREAWVVAERKDGQVLDVSLEAIHELKRMGEDPSAVLMGTGTEEAAAQLAHHGAGRVYVLDSKIFDPYCSAIHAPQLAELVKTYRPILIVAGATSSVNEYFPRAAALIKAGLVTDCRVFSIEDHGKIILSKPMYNEKAYVNIMANGDRVVMATVKPGTFGMGVPDETRKAQVIEVEPIPTPKDIPVKRLGHLEADPGTVDVSEAEVILAGGRGVGTKENFERLEELAEIIGATLGGSRPAVDKGWVSFEQQIGLSGKSVAPEIYIACGISGSSYHLMGMKDAKFVIAINKDMNAPLTKISDTGAIADLNQIIPEMIKILRKKNAGALANDR